MNALTFAWRNLVRQPARALLGVMGIAAVGALLFDMLLLSNGLVLSMQATRTGIWSCEAASGDVLWTPYWDDSEEPGTTLLVKVAATATQASRRDVQKYWDGPPCSE